MKKTIPPSQLYEREASTDKKSSSVLCLSNNFLSLSLSRVRNKDEERGKGLKGQTDDDDDDVIVIIRSGSKTG